MAKNIYDMLWKAVLEDVYPDFLRLIFKDADKLFDFDRGFIFLDTELSQLFPDYEAEDALHIDKLARGVLKNGTQALFYGHVEIEAGHKPGFAHRMFVYNARLSDKYKCPVWSFAIYTGGRASYRPGKYEQEFLGTRILFEFESLKITDYEGREKELEESNNAFDIVILCVLLSLKKNKVLDEHLGELKITLAKNLLKKNFSKKITRSVLHFLANYIYFEKQEINYKFENAIYHKTKSMGMLEMLPQIQYLRAKEDGKIEEKTIFVTNLLNETTFSIKKIAHLANVSEDVVRNIKNSIAQ